MGGGREARTKHETVCCGCHEGFKDDKSEGIGFWGRKIENFRQYDRSWIDTPSNYGKLGIAFSSIFNQQNLVTLD